MQSGGSPPSKGTMPSSEDSKKDFFHSYVSATRPLTSLPSAFSPDSDGKSSSPNRKSRKRKKGSEKDVPLAALPEDEYVFWKIRRRRKQNRIVARTSRQKEKNYVNSLESKIKELENAYKKLAKQIETLKSENMELNMNLQ